MNALIVRIRADSTGVVSSQKFASRKNINSTPYCQ